MISALVTLIILAVVVALALWLVRYLGGPKPIEVVIIVLACLIAILVLLSLIGVVDVGVFRYHDVVTMR